jgi:hypothetical protein
MPWRELPDNGRMAWTAPTIDRLDPPLIAGERPALEAWLDYHRQTLLYKCAGLTAEQLRQRAVPPSPLSLLGLVRHMAKVERIWFQERLAGRDVARLYATEDLRDGDFEFIDSADVPADFARFDVEVEAAREIAAAHALDDTFRNPRRGSGANTDLRWLYVHMIEEYARHNGHADLLRERVDGVTGD